MKINVGVLKLMSLVVLMMMYIGWVQVGVGRVWWVVLGSQSVSCGENKSRVRAKSLCRLGDVAVMVMVVVWWCLVV